MVKDFFYGRTLTKFFSHTCLVLIPKVESPTTFFQLRPISLSNFSSKVISKIVSNRLTNLLPKIISKNQTGFIKGRLITENILLTQEIIQNIKSKNKGGNVVIKLDMVKAYDKVSSQFLTFVLRKMGFTKNFTNMILRLFSNVWYSIIINGTRYNFFLIY